MKMRVVGGVGLALAIGAACSSGPTQGDEGGSCFPNGTCNTGLTCLSNLCVKTGADAGNDVNVPDTSTPADAANDVVTEAASDAATDAATDAASDAATDASAWEPSQLSGLVLWLQQSGLSGDAGAVSVWSDSSGNNKDFTANQTAPTRDTAAIGGNDAVKFQATPLVSAQGAFSWSTGNLVIEVVTKLGACTGGCPLWSTADGNTAPPLLLQAAGADAGSSLVLQGVMRTDTGLSAPFAAGAHVVGLRRTGSTTAEVRVDGTATSFTLSSNLDLSAVETASLGVYENILSNTTTFLTGDIAEVVAAQNPSNSDVSQLEAYLKAKYGL